MRAAAISAIAASPLNATAMRQLGMLADPGQTKETGLRFFVAAEGISRRDLSTQLALIEAAIIAEDLSGVLLHYDRTLRIYEAAKPLLFPALMQASRQASVQDELLRYADSSWFVPFIAQLLTSPGKRDDLAGFLVKAKPRLAPADANKLSTLLLNRLLRDGQFNQAQSWLEQSEPRLSQAMREFGIVPATTNPLLGAFAWAFSNRPSVVVALGENRSLAVSIEGGGQAPVAERITLLPPAGYDFAVNLAAGLDSPPAQLVWELRCEATGAQNLTWRFSPDPQAGSHSYTGRLVLSPACPVQHWTLSVGGRDPRIASSIRITKMSLTPVHNDR